MSGLSDFAELDAQSRFHNETKNIHLKLNLRPFKNISFMLIEINNTFLCIYLFSKKILFCGSDILLSVAVEMQNGCHVAIQ
jgi:hypothetical protein